jgi:urease accessory protein
MAYSCGLGRQATEATAERGLCMLKLTTILGSRADPHVAERLHQIGHHGAVEVLSLSAEDAARKRLRATTREGTDCAIALPREMSLFDGAVLLLEDLRAIVVHFNQQSWLRLVPQSAAAALELGYHAGNLHWRVRFEGAVLLVAIEGSVESYKVRIASLIEGGQVRAEVERCA